MLGYKIKTKTQKRPTSEFINPINYTWKNIYKIMNKIKSIWRMNSFGTNFNLDIQQLFKIIYENLQSCDKEPNLKLKNNIIENDCTKSFFQSNLLEILPKEKNLYDSYENLFSKKKNFSENNMALFEYFIYDSNILINKIKMSPKSQKQLKKLRWYCILDEDNFLEDKFKDNKYKSFNIDFSEDVENLDDPFNDKEKKAIIEEYEQNQNNKVADNLEEIYEKYIIDDELVNKLLTLEKNELFFLIKWIYLSINIFCKSFISYLLYNYLNSNESKEMKEKILINDYLKSFANFVDTCTIINEKCSNVNLTMNYLYKSLFKEYPDFPKFSIYRMCLKVWFKEINTHLLGDNTILYEINKIISSLFSENMKEELLNKMKENINNYFYKSQSLNNEKINTFNFNASFPLLNNSFISFSLNINEENYTNNNLNNILGSSNIYNNSDKQYKILQKGLSIINDTILNEYSAYLLNYSKIDTNTFYDNFVYELEDNIKNYIHEVFNNFFYDKNTYCKIVLDNILEYFDNYFFKNCLIPNLRLKIYETIFLCIQNNLMIFSKNKYLDNKINIISNTNVNSVYSSEQTNCCSHNILTSSSILDLEQNFNNNENAEIKTEEIKKEIINFIIKNISYEKTDHKSLYIKIEQKLDTINEQINLYDLFISNSKWHEEHINMIKKSDEKLDKEISIITNKSKIDIPFHYEQFKRYLLSYSLQYDWDFIKKVKVLEKYYGEREFEYMEEEEDDMNNFDNSGPNDFGGNFDLKQSFFGFNM